MRFVQLTMKNFRAYVGDHFLSLDHEPGLYLVSGINTENADLGSNGAAKSTIWNAVAWCFWGKTLLDEQPGSSVEPWSGEHPTAVTVRWEFNETLYELERGRHPNSLQLRYNESGASVWGDWRVVDQAQVDEILPISYDLFRHALVLAQSGQMFLDLTPEKQSQLLTDTLLLDKYTRASELAGDLLRSVKDDASTSETLLATHQARGQMLESLIADELVKSKGFAEERKQELDTIRAEMAEKARQLKALDVKEFETEPDVVALEADIDDLSAASVAAAATVASMGVLLGDIQGDIRRLEAVVVKLSGMGGECPMCHQQVSQSHFLQELETAEGEIEGLRAVRSEAFAAYTDEQIVVEQYSQQLQKQRRLLASERVVRDTILRAKAQHEGAVDRLRDDIAALNTRGRNLSAKANPHKQALEQLRVRLAGAQEAENKANDELVELAASAQRYALWVDGFKKIRLNLIDHALAAIEEATNSEAEALGLHGGRIEFATEKVSAAGKTVRTFSATIRPPGMEEPVRWKSYCGGEQQRWQLAARFGLAECLLASAGIEPNIEILDEPTRHLSPEGVEGLLIHLRARALRLGRQIWLVDHHVFPSDCFDGVFSVEHSVEGSRVKYHSR